jgi:hypothetical protein
MIRFLLRFLGLWILAAGFIFFVYDGTKYIASNEIRFTRVSDVWSNVHQSSLTALQPALEHYGRWLWNPVATSILELPVELVFGIIGALLILLGRKKRRLIGYARD